MVEPSARGVEAGELRFTTRHPEPAQRIGGQNPDLSEAVEEFLCRGRARALDEKETAVRNRPDRGAGGAREGADRLPDHRFAELIAGALLLLR